MRPFYVFNIHVSRYSVVSHLCGTFVVGLVLCPTLPGDLRGEGETQGRVSNGKGLSLSGRTEFLTRRVSGWKSKESTHDQGSTLFEALGSTLYTTLVRTTLHGPGNTMTRS